MILPNKCSQMDIFTLADYQNHLHLVSLPGLYPSLQYHMHHTRPHTEVLFVCLFICLFICWPVCFSFIHNHSLIHPFLKTLQQNHYIYQVSINTINGTIIIKIAPFETQSNA